MLDKFFNLFKKKPVTVKIMMLDKGYHIPEKAHPSDAGYDLFCAANEVIIPPHEVAKVSLGFCCALPEGYELQIRPKSGLALNNYLTIINTPGTVDCHYRGQVCALVMNHGTNPYTFHRGEKVCQGVISELPRVELEQVNELDETDRGIQGFGSTGK